MGGTDVAEMWTRNLGKVGIPGVGKRLGHLFQTGRERNQNNNLLCKQLRKA